jgi:hypothetical protein
MPTTRKLDDILWAQYRAAAPRPVPPNLHAPRNYIELAAWIDFDADADDPFRTSRASAWSALTHAFFHTKSPEFFSVPPPDNLSVEEQALWAGIAEALCSRLDLPVPSWVYEQRYYLPEPWDPFLLRVVTSERSIEERLADADEEFRRRNVVANARDYLAA